MRPVGNGFVWVLCIILARPAMANTVTVDTLEDLPGSSGKCSLRDAIDEVITPTPNPPPGDCGDSDPNGVDTITFSVTGTIDLLDVLPRIENIDEGLNIVGPGARLLTISGNKIGDGIGAVQVLRVQPSEKVTIEGVTIANGRAPKNGGGIQNFGQLTVKNISFIGNTAVEDGGAISNEKPGQLTVLNSTFSGNVILDVPGQEEEGGAIVNIEGTATIANSTFFGNSVPDTGGAIHNSGNNDGTGKVTLINSTINGNTASQAGGGVFTEKGGTITLGNTLLAANPGNNCGSDTGVVIDAIFDGGGNLDDGTTCGITRNDSLMNMSADLDPAGLKNNGGPTDTVGLTSASPAIDMGLNGVCEAAPINNLDQRGAPFIRPTDGDGDGNASCDIGAFERDAVAPGSNLPPVVTNPGNQTGVVGANVNLAISANDPNGNALSFTATGLPAGLSINAGTGIVTGTLSTAGTSNVTGTVSDGHGGTTPVSFIWTVTSPSTGPAPKCSGRTATVFVDSVSGLIVGGPDGGLTYSGRLRGTPGADIMVGTAGKDILVGSGGNDWICGGGGNDNIKGGAGKDRLFGERGNDKLSGGSGSDRCDGGPGRDRFTTCERILNR